MKLKSLLKESKVWERKFGEPLPTLEDTTKRFKLKQEEELTELRLGHLRLSNNQEKAALKFILHLDKKFPTKQKGHFPRSMRDKIANYIYRTTKDTIADRGDVTRVAYKQNSEEGKKQIAKELAMGYEQFIEHGYQSPIEIKDIKGIDIKQMAREWMRYVKIPSIKDILK